MSLYVYLFPDFVCINVNVTWKREVPLKVDFRSCSSLDAAGIPSRERDGRRAKNHPLHTTRVARYWMPPMSYKLVFVVLLCELLNYLFVTEVIILCPGKGYVFCFVCRIFEQVFWVNFYFYFSELVWYCKLYFLTDIIAGSAEDIPLIITWFLKFKFDSYIHNLKADVPPDIRV